MIQQPTAIISLSGPSKSGKSMLFANVMSEQDYQHITVHGSDINSSKDLWGEVLDELQTPASSEVTTGTNEETTYDGRGGVNIGPLKAEGGGATKSGETQQESNTYDRRGLRDVIMSVELDNFILFIDDAHLIDQSLHKEISESLKNAYERGLSICVAYIPYRSDDLTRANPDLSARIDPISLDYWEEKDLSKIGEAGFNELEVSIPDQIIGNLSKESVGSPHLMQKLCLDICREMNIIEKGDEPDQNPIDRGTLKKVLRHTANGLGRYSTIYEIISGNVTTRGGGERNTFQLKSGVEGDVYDAILHGIASNPPKVSFDQSDIIRRVGDVCEEEEPQSGNLTQAIKRVDRWIDNSEQETPVFEWREETKNVEIPDPYLIFYLRWSDDLSFEPDLEY